MIVVIIIMPIISLILFLIARVLLEGTIVHNCYSGRRKHKMIETEKKSFPIFDRLLFLSIYKNARSHKIIAGIVFIENLLLLGLWVAQIILCVVYIVQPEDNLMFVSISMSAIYLLVPLATSAILDHGYQKSKQSDHMSNISFVVLLIIAGLILIVTKL